MIRYTVVWEIEKESTEVIFFGGNFQDLRASTGFLKNLYSAPIFPSLRVGLKMKISIKHRFKNTERKNRSIQRRTWRVYILGRAEGCC